MRIDSGVSSVREVSTQKPSEIIKKDNPTTQNTTENFRTGLFERNFAARYTATKLSFDRDGGTVQPAKQTPNLTTSGSGTATVYRIGDPTRPADSTVLPPAEANTGGPPVTINETLSYSKRLEDPTPVEEFLTDTPARGRSEKAVAAKAAPDKPATKPLKPAAAPQPAATDVPEMEIPTFIRRQMD